MSDFDSSLTSVLEQVLRGNYADEETGELSLKESQRVRRLIRDYLEITDSPSERDPFQIANFIYWSCWSASRDAAERYLDSLTEKQVADLLFGDVLALLAPGQEASIEELADENEEERRAEREG